MLTSLLILGQLIYMMQAYSRIFFSTCNGLFTHQSFILFGYFAFMIIGIVIFFSERYWEKFPLAS